MIGCPKCGYEIKYKKCRACRFELNSGFFANPHDFYIATLEYWADQLKSNRDKFLVGLLNMSEDSVSFEKDLSEIEQASRYDEGLATELEKYKELFGNLKYAEACVNWYLKQGAPKALDGFKDYIANEENELENSYHPSDSNIFQFYIKIINNITEDYEDLPHGDEWDERLTDLYKAVILCVNKLIRSKADRCGKSKFRVYKSKDSEQKNIHDHYVEYLKALNSAIKKVNSREVADVWNEVY